MDKIAPLIPSSETGLLGVAHLPRLWLKLLLHSYGLLPEGYRSGEGGFDSWLCEQFAIDREAFVAYVTNERPDYLTLEKWVESHAADLTPRKIAEWNAIVRSRQLKPDTAAERRAMFGITDEEFGHAISLNNLDDWAIFHAHLTAAVPAKA